MNKFTPSVETLLAQAVELATPAERQAFVEQACAGDEALQGQVERLISNHFRAGSFLERPAVAMDPDGLVSWEPAGAAESPGTVIGPYKLLEQIGEGGMGVVFMAEQAQPLRRKVALKVIKPGMDSKQVIARFEAERQALALMDHPNIARVLDAGTTDSGRPYFVMELVKGIPITEYCDQARLTTRQRLELFQRICLAVQHAHQKGIIHRDLKPGNILVTLHDGEPVPKVIDFGIAKATGQQLTEKTMFTGFAQMVGTPLYMSPEQAALSATDVDTRSDVYALGVLLYELLTGTTPFESDTVKKAGLDEMRRMIREEEPPTPSRRLSTLSAQACSTISQRRGVDGRRLGQVLRGELDWIVMKALEKDRDRRYESASAFAVDVERYLNDEAVQACPPSARYRFRKFARRNKTALTTLAAVALALLLGTGISIWQAVEASRARWLADERLEKEKQAHDFAEDQRQRALASYGKALEAVKKMLVEVGDETVSAVPEMQKWREHLLGEAITFYGSLIVLNPHDAGTYFARAHVYRLLGKSDRERADLEKAIELEPLRAEYHHILAFALYYYPEGHDQPDDQRILFHQKRAVELTPTVATRSVLAEIYGRLGRKDEAIAEYRKAAEADPDTLLAYAALADAALLNGNLREARLNREKAVESGLLGRWGNSSVWDSEKVNHGPTLLAWAYNHLSHVLHEMGDDDQALIALNRGLELTGVSGHARAWALFGRAEVYTSQRNYAAALADYDRGMLLDPDSRNEAWYVYKRRGLMHFYLGHYEKALADIAKGIDLRPADVSNLLWIPVAKVAACPDEGFRKGILALADRTVEVLSGKPDTSQGGAADAYAARAQLFAAMKQPERARADYERALPLHQQKLEKQKATLGPDNTKTLSAKWDVVETGARAGKFDRVEPVLVDLLERSNKKESLGQRHSRLAALGKILVDQEKYAQAEPILRESMAIRVKEMPENWLRYNAASMLGGALLGQKKYAAAEPLLLQGYEGLKQHEDKILAGYKDIRLTEAAERLVRLYEATKQPEKAAAWREKILESSNQK